MGGGGLTRDCLRLIDRLSDSMSGVVARNITAGTSKLDMGMGIGRTRVGLARVSGKLDLSGVMLYRLYNLPLGSRVHLTSRSMRDLALLRCRMNSGMTATLTGHRRLQDLSLTGGVCSRGIGVAHTKFLPAMTLATGCVMAGPSLMGNFRHGFHNV